MEWVLKVWTFIKNNKKDAVWIVVLLSISTMAATGWSKYWSSKVIITAYKFKDTLQSEQIKELESMKAEVKEVIKYKEGPIRERIIYKNVETVAKTDTKTDTKTETTFPKQQKFWEVGVSYQVDTHNVPIHIRHYFFDFVYGGVYYPITQLDGINRLGVEVGIRL